MRFSALVLLGACTSGSTTTALFNPADDDFYALPFPNDLRRHADGTLDLSALPANSPLVENYRDVAATLDGFGINASVYARFDGALDPMSLPDPAGSTADDASVFLVDIDPASPHVGQRSPVIVTFRADPRGTMGPNSLCARPYPGFTLDEGTTYALVITNKVRDASGEPVHAAPAMSLDDGPYATLGSFLDGAGISRGSVVSAAVFTTQHATDIMAAIRKGVFASPAPVIANVHGAQPTANFKLYTGTYMAPNFQAGPVPYTNPPNGEISVGPDGAAVVARTETMRFALTVPGGTTPAGGWPIAIYAHGTGGDYVSFVDDGTGDRLAQQGIATISTDQVLHGPRNPNGNPETDFFNFGNPYAARDNALQGAADAFSQLRLANGISFKDGPRQITFSRTKVYFFGHSQGGLTGPGFVAYEPSLQGAVFSGTAGLIYLALLYKTAPVDIPSLVKTIIRDDPVDEDNPTLALVQMWVERADPANYAPHMVRDPIQGVPAKNIFQTEGFTDTYAPNPGIEAFATALGGDLVMTADEKPVEGLTLRARMVMNTPFANNLDGVTAVLAQYKQAPGSDGHFVVFEVPAAEQQSAQFLGTLATTGTATVVSPN